MLYLSLSLIIKSWQRRLANYCDDGERNAFTSNDVEKQVTSEGEGLLVL